jgi:hypothetical protein
LLPLNPPRESTSSGLAVVFQVIALILGFAALIVGAFGVYMAAFPGPCGDNPGPGLGVIEAWVADAPLGLLILAVGVFVKKGSPRLRRVCILTSLVTLSLPVVASLLLQRWHCP